MTSSLDHLQKHCWVCYGTDDDEPEKSGNWVSPCKCRGSTRWVHQVCVQRWVEEKFRENIDIKVRCPQCTTEYIIVHGKVNCFVQVLNKLDQITHRLCPFLVAGTLVCCTYWSAVSYGAISVMQIMGDENAISLMNDTNPCMLLLVLPSIPLTLVLGNVIDFEEPILLLVQQFALRLPLLRTILPSFLYEPVTFGTNFSNLFQISEFINRLTTTNYCEALCMPFTATLVGNLLFVNSSNSSIKKTLLGGLVYITVKCALNIYQRQHNAIQERTKKVVDYPDFDDEESN